MTDPAATIDRVEGCLLGLALGDAVGAIFEGQSRERLRSRFDTPTEAFRFAASGALRYTDDAQMAFALTEHLRDLPPGASIDPESLMGDFVRVYEPWRGYGRGTRTLIETFRDGGDYEFLAGNLFPGGSHGNGAAMRAAPLGLRYRDADEIRRQSRLAAWPTHRHPLGIEGAALVALAVSLIAGAETVTPAKLSKALLPHCETAVFAGRIERMGEIARPDQIDELGNGIEAHESVVTALACFAISPDDYVSAVSLALWQGGDTDTIAAMTGALCGARVGASLVPRGELSRLEDGAPFLTYVRGLAESFVATMS